MSDEPIWTELDLPDLPVGRVTTVVAGGRALCVTHTAEGWGVLDIAAPIEFHGNGFRRNAAGTPGKR